MNDSQHPSTGVDESRRSEPAGADDPARPRAPTSPREIGGRNGPDPVRYGDWEKNGRCIDF